MNKDKTKMKKSEIILLEQIFNGDIENIMRYYSSRITYTQGFLGIRLNNYSDNLLVSNSFIAPYFIKNNNIHFLLGKERIKDEKQFWGFLGGKLEKTDPGILDGAFREFGEEYYDVKKEKMNKFVSLSKKKIKEDYFSYYCKEQKMLIFFIHYSKMLLPKDTDKVISSFKMTKEISKIKWVKLNILKSTIFSTKGPYFGNNRVIRKFNGNMKLRPSFSRTLTIFLREKGNIILERAIIDPK